MTLDVNKLKNCILFYKSWANNSEDESIKEIYQWSLNLLNKIIEEKIAIFRANKEMFIREWRTHLQYEEGANFNHIDAYLKCFEPSYEKLQDDKIQIQQMITFYNGIYNGINRDEKLEFPDDIFNEKDLR